MRLTARLVATLLLPAAIGPGAAAAADAPGAPGATSHFDLARKDCVGTARNTTSKVWFTVADGVLSDVYYPTIDTTNVETMRLIVTDGATFTDLQGRDTTYEVAPLGPSGMSCRIVSTARSGRYRLVTDFLASPSAPAVLVRTRVVPLVGSRRDYRVYARLDATVNGNGGGGAGNGGVDTATIDTSTGSPVPVSSDTVTATNAANRDYAEPVHLALAADRPFAEASSGYAGTASDGLAALDAAHALGTATPDAGPGNVVQTVRLDLSRRGEAVLALGFGATRASAVATATGSARARFDRLLRRYEAGWRRYDEGLRRPLPHLLRDRDLRQTYWTSANVLKASEDKTFPGAIVASLASLGQAVSAGDPATTFWGSYREVFARDLYEAWTGLVADGDLATARATVRFLFDRQQRPDGSFPRNSLINGKEAPDSFGVQLDEVAYPILMAHELRLRDPALYAAGVRPAADFLVAHGLAAGVERWEEQGGWSPSTIAAEVAGLVAAADMARWHGDMARAALWLGVADDYQRSVKGWTVTTTGPIDAGSGGRYFIRLSKTGDPDAAITYTLGNGGPALDQRAVVDAGFLELVRLGLLPADDPDVLRSLPVVDATIRTDTPSGPGWHRYNGDGYGDRASDGRPWAPSGVGTGHVWPVLSAERAEHLILVGDRAGALDLLASMERYAGGVGLVPEQDWELPDLPPSPFGTPPETASIGFVDGEPAGSASPLTWAAAAYVRLAQDLRGWLVDRPLVTLRRYVLHRQGATPIAITAPADRSAATGSPLHVAGTAAPGSEIVVAATNTDRDSATTVARTRAGADGTWSVDLPIVPGTSVVDAVATDAAGATGHAQATVVLDVVEGAVLLDRSDPSGDDHGPGPYAYPTAADFHDGAFDLQRFQVVDAGADVVFRVQVRDLTPTFGSPLGAQLLDVYVHDPAAPAAATSTAASFPGRNYVIAPAFAWSRLLEVQGFGQRYVDAAGATVGTITIAANEISRFVTFRVPKATLGGTPGPGWGFVVTLTGQDGYSPDQARGFAPTPQPYQFGLCAAPSSDPRCTADPGSVPKVLDLLDPDAGTQADLLDFTVHAPVVLAGVAATSS